MRLTKPILIALLSGLGMMVVAEVGARVLLTQFEFGDCYVDGRNPNFRRGWPEFTRPHERPANSRLTRHH